MVWRLRRKLSSVFVFIFPRFSFSLFFNSKSNRSVSNVLVHGWIRLCSALICSAVNTLIGGSAIHQTRTKKSSSITSNQQHWILIRSGADCILPFIVSRTNETEPKKWFAVSFSSFFSLLLWRKWVKWLIGAALRQHGVFFQFISSLFNSLDKFWKWNYYNYYEYILHKLTLSSTSIDAKNSLNNSILNYFCL